MSPHEPQEHSAPGSEAPVRRPRSLRELPGFTFAAVTFVLVVVLGVSGTAIANWNQSATVSIGITAGAAPAPTPTPTPTQTPRPGGSADIVVAPVVSKKPTKMDPESVKCSYNGNADNGKSGKFTFTWADSASNRSRYVVSLSLSGTGTIFNDTNVTTNNVTIKLGTTAAFGNYILRVQPMNGDTIAGDPIYRTFRYAGPTDFGCYWADPAGTSPSGNVKISPVPGPNPPAPNNNVLALSWTAPAAGATNYVVSIMSETSTYGAEFTTTSTAGTFTFPPRVAGQGTAVFYGRYSLRIMPMKDGQGGDPVYIIVQYLSTGMGAWSE